MGSALGLGECCAGAIVLHFTDSMIVTQHRLDPGLSFDNEKFMFYCGHRGQPFGPSVATNRWRLIPRILFMQHQFSLLTFRWMYDSMM